jgi:flagellar biosynthesis/type III secretory pathway M-ring protein FliF/YscJ
MRKRRKKQGRVEPGPRALPAASEESEFDPTNVVQEKMQERLAEQQAFRAKLEEETLKSLKLPAVKTRKSEVLAKLLSEQAHRDPVTMVQLLRTWLNEEGA